DHPERVGMNHPHKALHFALESPETVDLGHTCAERLVRYWRLTGEPRALAGVYDATGERGYLDAARAVAARATAMYRGTPAAGDWKMGIGADGVAGVHALTRDDALRRWL